MGVSAIPWSIISRSRPLVSGWNAKQTKTERKEHPPKKKYGAEPEDARNAGVEIAIMQLTNYKT